jgi:hypothetical protein
MENAVRKGMQKLRITARRILLAFVKKKIHRENKIEMSF